MPVTFPDGSTAELVYPPPSTWQAWARSRTCRFYGFGILDLGSSWSSPAAGRSPGGSRRSASGHYQTVQGRPAQLWQAAEHPGVLSGYGSWLHYRIGAWTVLAAVSDRAMAAEVVRNLEGRQTGDGFVVSRPAAHSPCHESTGRAAAPSSPSETTACCPRPSWPSHGA